MYLPKSLTLIRHGESEGNAIAKLRKGSKEFSEDVLLQKGTHLFDLSPLGIEQAKLTGNYLKQNNISYDTYLVSQYLRAKKTFDLIFQGRIPDEVRSDLNEFDRGYGWLYPDKMEELFPTEVEALRLKGRTHHRAIGGENYTDLELRIRNFIIWLALFHSNENVVIVGHGTWIKTCWVILTGEKRPKWDVPNASVMTFNRSDSGKKLIFQDMVTPWEGKL